MGASASLLHLLEWLYRSVSSLVAAAGHRKCKTSYALQTWMEAVALLVRLCFWGSIKCKKPRAPRKLSRKPRKWKMQKLMRLRLMSDVLCFVALDTLKREPFPLALATLKSHTVSVDPHR